MADKPNIDQLFNLRASFPTEAEQKAFFAAAENNDTKTLNKILKKWPDAPAKWRMVGEPVIRMHYAEMKPDTIELLIAHGADINAFENNGNWSAIIHASFHDDLASVEKLLRLGAAPDKANTYEKTPLCYAAEKGAYAIADLLVVCGANPASARHYVKDDEMRRVIDAAKTRRDTFMASLEQQFASAPVPAAPTAIELPANDSAIQIMKRIEFKKKGLPMPAEAGPGKKNWAKRLLHL
jgi:hypothetical protein